MCVPLAAPLRLPHRQIRIRIQTHTHVWLHTLVTQLKQLSRASSSVEFVHNAAPFCRGRFSSHLIGFRRGGSGQPTNNQTDKSISQTNSVTSDFVIEAAQ